MGKQPNVLLFLADGVQAHAINRRGVCITPNIDALAARGLRFTRAYTPSPTCSPARASLMTGLLPHNHGVLQVEHTVDSDQCVLRKDKPHFAQRLSDAGYATGYFGKWHIERTNRVSDFGWQESWVTGSDVYAHLKEMPAEKAHPPIGDPHCWLDTPEGYRRTLHYGVTDQTLDQRPAAETVRHALDYLANTKNSDKPWCCCVSFSEPNEALIATREAFNKYRVDDIELPENLEDRHLNNPGLYRRQLEIFDHFTRQQWRETLACYYARITELDTLMGRLIKQLEDTGQLDNTIILYTADHGRYVGAHGFEGHNIAGFEELYGIPMIAAGPGVAKGTSEARVGLHDLCPTILELCGASSIESADSASFARVMRDPASGSNRTGGFAENHGTRFLLSQRVFWEGDWKLVFNGFDYDELYNMADDPLELNNLASDPRHHQRLREMTRTMWKRVRDTSDTTLYQTHFMSMRMAAVGPLAAE